MKHRTLKLIPTPKEVIGEREDGETALPMLEIYATPSARGERLWLT